MATKPENGPARQNHVRGLLARIAGSASLLRGGISLGSSVVLHASVLAVVFVLARGAGSSPPPGHLVATLRDEAGGGEPGLQWPQPRMQSTKPPSEPRSEAVPDLEALTRDVALIEPGPHGFGEAAVGLGAGSSGEVLGIGQGISGGAVATGGRGRVVTLFGMPIAAQRLVYVLDFSASTKPVFGILSQELYASVERLTPLQSFAVILFYTRDTRTWEDALVVESMLPSLTRASEENKQRLHRWLDARRPQGNTRPVAALKRAIALRPDAIVFISDGGFDDRWVEQIAQANSPPTIPIHCFALDLQLLTVDQQMAVGGQRAVVRMRRIASESGGKFELISARDSFLKAQRSTN